MSTTARTRTASPERRLQAERLLGSTTRPMLVVQQAPRAAYRSVLVPVVAMISGALLRGEPLGPVEAAAMACRASSGST